MVRCHNTSLHASQIRFEDLRDNCMACLAACGPRIGSLSSSSIRHLPACMCLHEAMQMGRTQVMC